MSLITDPAVLRTKEVFNNVWPLLYSVRYYCKQRPIKHFFNISYFLLCFAKEIYIELIIYTKCYFYVTAKESSYLSRLGADVWQPQKVYCVLVPCARNGARLWKTSPQVLHTYSRWAARRSWTCFTCRFKASIRLNFRPQREHSCRFPRTA